MRYPDRRLASVFVAALLRVACSKQSANKTNFKTAIQTALDQKPVCISVGLPREVPNWNGKEQKDDQLEVLIGPGLAKKSQAMVHRSAMDFMLDDRRRKLIPGIRYDLTDEAKKYVHQSKPQVATLMGTLLQDLCYGTQEVTESSDSRSRRRCREEPCGKSLTNGSYVIRQSGQNTPAFQKKYFTAQILNTENTPAEAKMDFVLMTDGWRVASGL